MEPSAENNDCRCIYFCMNLNSICQVVIFNDYLFYLFFFILFFFLQYTLSKIKMVAMFYPYRYFPLRMAIHHFDCKIGE